VSRIRSAYGLTKTGVGEGRLAELAGIEGKPIVLVCRTDKRSATAARALRAAGFALVEVLRRGMESGTKRNTRWIAGLQRR